MSFKYYCSYALFRGFRAYFRFAYQFLKLRPTNLLRWETFTEKTSSNAAIAYTMFNAPRWNTHGLITLVGPFQAAQGITIDLNHIAHQADSWTLVVYRQPTNEVILIVTEAASGSVFYALPPGTYTVVLRCYETRFPLQLPSLQIDEHLEIPARALPAKPLYIPTQVWKKRSHFFQFCHYYVHEALAKYGESVFTKQEYLPVGNPETFFRFGVISTPRTGNVRVEPRLLIESLIYITVYNGSSFPVLSERITTQLYSLRLPADAASYLFRIIPLHKDFNAATIGCDLVFDKGTTR